MSGVDDLFTSEAPKPVLDQLGRVERLLILAVPLNLLGITCFTGVPGAALSLWAWHLADEEVERVRSGALPADRMPRARRARNLAFSQVSLAGALLLVQAVLFGMGWYQAAWHVLMALAGQDADAPPP